MKTIFLKTILISLLITACSKNDDSTLSPDPNAENYRLLEARYSNGSIDTYEYNTYGKIAKVSRNGAIAIIYNYDSQNRLIEIENSNSNYQYYFKNYTYTGNNPKPDESITRYKVVGDPQETKYRNTYVYNNDLLIENNNYLWDPVNSNYYPSSKFVYEYDANNRLIKFSNNSNYTLFTNDANGNVTETKQFELKSGSTTQQYMWRSVTYTYDNKKDLFANLYPVPESESNSNSNNRLDQTLKDFNESGSTTNISNTSISYEYNEANYPVKATQSGNVTLYTLEKVQY